MLRSENPTRPQTIEDLLSSDLIAKVSHLDVSSRKIFAGKLQGERRSKKRGESVEFADHRPYTAGDDLRHIDWNIYARLDRFFMKLFMEEEDLSLHIVIDASASSDCGEPNKFYYMQQVAMAMGYIGLVNLNRVEITAIGLRDELVIPGGEKSIAGNIRDLRGRRRTHDLARFLCSIEPEAGTDFGQACKRIAMTRRGKGVMIVLSDFLMKEGYETGLRMLVGRGYDVFAIQTLSPQEVDPDIAGDLQLRDIEDGDMAEVTISAPLLKKYKENVSAYCQGLRDFCARREITALTIQTNTPIDTLLLDYLRKRGLLR
jgi:uncharacterized protein (DUF58 family)